MQHKLSGPWEILATTSEAGLDGRGDERETVLLRDVVHEATLTVFGATDLRQCHPTHLKKPG